MQQESDIILTGPPGSGKGTQARLLTRAFDMHQLATGDLFREEARRGTALGLQADALISKGNFVPDESTIAMVRGILEGDSTPVVFDGFPRTRAQAQALSDLLDNQGRTLSVVIALDVDDTTVAQRLTTRITCGRCQESYSLRARPPRREGLCDICSYGLPDAGRSDDSADVIAHRLSRYREMTLPVHAYYREQGLLVNIDASASIEQVAAQVQALVSERSS